MTHHCNPDCKECTLGNDGKFHHSTHPRTDEQYEDEAVLFYSPSGKPVEYGIPLKRFKAILAAVREEERERIITELEKWGKDTDSKVVYVPAFVQFLTPNQHHDGEAG